MVIRESDARDVIRNLLKRIEREIDLFGKSIIRFSDIENISDPVKMEGFTSDVLCKLSNAAFEHGISIDATFGTISGYLIIFEHAKEDYRVSLQKCEKSWRWVEEQKKEIIERIEKGNFEIGVPPYVTEYHVKKLDDLPRKAAIYILRVVNAHRAKGEVDEFIEKVLLLSFEDTLRDFPCILDIVACAYPARKQEIEKIKKELDKTLKNKPTEIGDLYTVFSTFGEHFFIMFDNAHYFQDEPEYKNMVGKTVFDVYPTEVDPKEIKKLDDLTKNDAIRLVRVLNSFRRKDTVDMFLSNVGDFENIYELFQLYIAYIFHEYENANFFLNEPELDPKEKEFQTIILNRPTKFEGEFD